MNRYEQYLKSQPKVSPVDTIPLNTPLTGEQLHLLAKEHYTSQVGAAMKWYADQLRLGRVVVWTGVNLFSY